LEYKNAGIIFRLRHFINLEFIGKNPLEIELLS